MDSIGTRKTLAKGLAAALAVLVGMGLFSCAPGSPEKTERAKEQNGAASYTWSAESDCAMCHEREASSLSDGQCLAKTHSDEGMECVLCHTDESRLAVVHEGAETEKARSITRLKKTKIDDAVCLSCHAGEELVAATANSMALADEEGTVVNPHDTPRIEKHADITCGSCHAMHEAGADAEAEAFELCGTCHHKDIYRSCSSCHEV